MAKTWLVTGCSSGLGKAVALEALKRGEKVAATARNPETLREMEKKYPGQALALRLDLENKESMEAAVKETRRRLGEIDVLVNNAGHGYRAAVEESEPDQVAELFQTNFFGPAELIKLVLPEMRERKSGLLVNVTSIGAVRGALGNGYYSAAKGALELLSEALAKEVGHLGIQVMLAEPGALRTGFYDDRLKESKLQIADYDVLAGSYRKARTGSRHDQPGSPEMAGKVLVETILRGDRPFRLLLGSDAVKAAEQTLEERLQELRDWQDVSRQSDYIEN